MIQDRKDVGERDVGANRANILSDDVGYLLEDDQQADNHCEEGNTFDECGGNDHGGADVATSFGLTGHAFHGALTDFTDADTGTNSGQTCSDSGAEVTPSDARYCLQCNE